MYKSNICSFIGFLYYSPMSDRILHIEKILSNLPKNPGVYQMKDKDGKVMYVWKAKNLKSRVCSYFMRTAELTMAKKQMVAKVHDIEILHTETEVEALVLETNLIKHLSPKYNILMKDDKSHAYIKITNSPVPELIKTRQKFRDGGEYFWPFVWGIEESLRAMKRAFKIRNCRVKFERIQKIHKNRDIGEKGVETEIVITDKAGRTLPCLDYYIWLCPAPCLLISDTIEKHNSHIDYARQFLKWNSSDLLSVLEAEMKEKAMNYEFEEAQKIKETLIALNGLHEKQKVQDLVDGDIDIFIKYEKYDKVYVALTQIRWWKIISVFRHEVTIGADDKDDIMTSFLARQYVDDEDLPGILIVASEPTDPLIVDFLSSKKIQLQIPKIGSKLELIEFTMNQLRDYAYKREMQALENRTLSREHMVNILTKLGYEYPKKWEIVFECYDISHTDGHFTYASRVSIVNGKPDTSRYKKYKIKSLEDGMIDDFASHKEVMYRRTLEWKELGNFPHLIIIDGWKWQLSSAISGIKRGIFDHFQNLWLPSQDESLPPICSIAKREEEIFLPNNKNPILFEKGTPELMVIQKARDESHRFSITANKSARMKSMKKNILEELPWFGPVTRKKLLKIAGSIDGVKNIPLEEIVKICSKAQIDTLRDHGLFNL